jgi:hypothetical protein
MTKAKSEVAPGTGPSVSPKWLWRWPGNWEAYKIPLFSLVLFGVLAIKSLYPDVLSFKRSKSYRFRGNALGFFVGDLSLFTTSSSEEAEARLVQVFPGKLQTKVQKVIRPVLTLCEKHEVDPFWVLSVMWTESHFKFKATSKKGAQGLMQVMPETYAHLMTQIKQQNFTLESDRGEDYLATVYPEAYKEMGYHLLVKKLRNLEVGIFYLKTLLVNFDHNFFHATVAYNMGPSWTKERIRTNQPVGRENRYLNKVMEAYIHITKNLSHNANVSFVSQQF